MTAPHVVALAGGVGGAKLADGLYRGVPDWSLSVVVNTADDMDMYGLRVCPDLDTVLYTLSSLADPVQGWGIGGDTFATFDLLGRYGAPTWFRIGDRDFATHIRRSELLRQGQSLTGVTTVLAEALDVRARVLPMCDERVATLVRTPEGQLDFQDYFVRRQHRDDVQAVGFDGIDDARLTPEVGRVIADADAIIICPSNPFVSVGPILTVPGMSHALRTTNAPIVAVSPIVGGEALRGPAAHMLASMGHEVSALGVARLYAGLITGLVIDERDRDLAQAVEDLGLTVLVTQTVMRTLDDRRGLAERTLAFALALQ